MADKDLLLVISEVLIKQDQQSELLQQNNNTLLQFIGITNNFMDVANRQFEEQAKFNQLFLEELRNVRGELKGVQGEIKGVQSELVGVNKRLDNVEKAISNFIEVDDRLRRIEAVVFKP